jgi:hypothetical protein
MIPMSINLGYLIMSIMIIIPLLAFMFISKEDVEDYKKRYGKK